MTINTYVNQRFHPVSQVFDVFLSFTVWRIPKIAIFWRILPANKEAKWPHFFGVDTFFDYQKWILLIFHIFFFPLQKHRFLWFFLIFDMGLVKKFCNKNKKILKTYDFMNTYEKKYEKLKFLNTAKKIWYEDSKMKYKYRAHNI